MNIKNQVVKHKFLGEGTVIEQNGDYIIVHFSKSQVEKTFIFPESFEKFLKCTDEDLQAELESACAVKAEERERKEREEREEKLRKIEMERRQAVEATRTPSKHTSLQSRKSNENNLAFKCNFCDGGCNSACIGYKGACSDDQIKYNIEVRHHSWCSNLNSPCRQYIDGKITRRELDDVNKNGGFVCYESRMLTDWIAAAGEDLDDTKGLVQGRRIQDASSNSLAILTTRYPEIDEADRIIFGVFITGDAVEGDENNAGYVVAKEGYTIELTPGEAKRIKFWHYHKNTDGGIRWSQGLYRYLKDSACARILADILDVKSNPKDKAHAQEVLDYYCKIKRIDKDNIPTADGAI